MRNEFKIEFYRAVKSRGLLLSLISGLLIVVEQNRCAMACQGCGIAIFCFL